MRRKEPTVPEAEFKAKCLALFDEVEKNGRTFVVTKRGRPVARVIPLTVRKPRSLRGSLLHECDLMPPVDAPWDGEKRSSSTRMPGCTDEAREVGEASGEGHRSGGSNRHTRHQRLGGGDESRSRQAEV